MIWYHFVFHNWRSITLFFRFISLSVKSTTRVFPRSWIVPIQRSSVGDRGHPLVSRSLTFRCRCLQKTVHTTLIEQGKSLRWSHICGSNSSTIFLIGNINAVELVIWSEKIPLQTILFIVWLLTTYMTEITFFLPNITSLKLVQAWRHSICRSERPITCKSYSALSFLSALKSIGIAIYIESN